jgi:putative oxidoreductase
MAQTQLGIFIVRLAVGIIFLLHGMMKFQSGITNIAGWFDSIGIPGGMAYIVAIIEIVGGIGVILGVGTRVIAVLLSLTLVVAIVKVKLAAGFFGDGKMSGYEFELALLAMTILLALHREQAFSLMNVLKKQK